MTLSTLRLPELRADLLLMHAPPVFEFRDRRDAYSPSWAHLATCPSRRCTSTSQSASRRCSATSASTATT